MTSTPQLNPLRAAADSARNSSPFHAHFTPGMDTPRMIATTPAAVGTLDLARDLALPAGLAGYLLGIETPPSGHDHAFTMPRPNVIPAGKTQHLDPLAVIQNNSVCARAGARIIVATPPPTSFQAGIEVMYGQVELLRSVDPAAFNLVADGADAPTSAITKFDATFSWAECPAYATSFMITRADRRAVGGDQLEDIVLSAILAGLGELVDNLLVTAIMAGAPEVFTLGAAAARHTRFDELRAVVGTAGTGAAVGQDGVLRAAGILAELSGSSSATVVGRFRHAAAIAIRPELSVRAIRLNASGDTQVSVFANAQALVSSPADFWQVTA